jgi:threonine/homoserine/homoserine lactone efflux protein
MSLATLIIVLCGVVLGAFSAMAPLGPVTVLVIQWTLEGDPRGARYMGYGRAPVEAIYCGLATFGMVALLDQFPGARFGIEAFGTVVFAAVGVWLLFQRPETPEPGEEVEPRRRRWGVWTGFIISLLNPTLLLSWSAGVAIAVSMSGYEPTLVEKILFPIALGVGIALGYTILVAILRRFGEQIEARFVRRAIQLMGGIFVCLACWNGLELLGVL